MTVLRLVIEPEDMVAISAVFELESEDIQRLSDLDNVASETQRTIWELVEDTNDLPNLRDLANRLAKIREADHNANAVSDSLK